MKGIFENFQRAKKLLLLLVLTGFIFTAQGEVSVSVSGEEEDTTAAPMEKTKFTGLRFTGFARTWFFHRYLDIYDLGDAGRLTTPRNISLGDGYDQPLLYLLMDASPFPATRLAAEVAFDNRLLRGGAFNNTVDDSGRMASVWQIFNFKAETFTDIGTFRLTVGGGVNWYRMSPFTMWSANDFNTRDDMFERLPWEPHGDDFNRYSLYYQRGDIPRDQRWGNAHTQGVILEAIGLPGGLNATIIVGKGAGSAGFQTYQTKTPLNLFAFRTEKVLGKHALAFNYIDQFGHNDNKVIYKEILKDGEKYFVVDNKLSQLATTLDGRFKLGRVALNAEVGLGSYLSPLYNKGLKEGARSGIKNVSTYKRNWDELLYTEVAIAGFPIHFQAYRVGKYFVNFSSSVQNVSVDQSILNVGQASANTASYDGLIPMIGQMTNNRQGINAIFTKAFGALRTRAGYGISQELSNFAGDIRNGSRSSVVAGNTDSATVASYTNSITFQHTLNNLARSRFGFWQRFGGPYDRIHNTYRRSYENIAITDTAVDYKKSFTSFDLELKYKFILFNRPVIVSSYIQYNSVQEKVSPLPKFNDAAFLRLLYNEYWVFYNLQRRITLVGMFGFQTVKGNQRTELADAQGNLILDANGRVVYNENGAPVNQKDFGYGVGIDYNFNERASIHLRQRWYTHKDANFTLDEFKGNEATLELKVFF